MAAFGSNEWIQEQAPKGLPVLWVAQRPRRDGKYAVTYAFTGRSIRSILTLEKLEAEKASGKYEIRISYK